MQVGEFLAWIDRASAERRADAARALARVYLNTEVDADTRNAMEAAMTILLDDPSTDVRIGLADVLGASAAAPRHIVISLAVDQPAVAELVLARSPLLIDAELVDIAAAAPLALQVAIASRPRVSSAVAAALAEVGERDACRALLDNPQAAVARISMKRIAERFGDEADLRAVLLERADCPADVHQMLIRRLGDALGSMMVVKSWAGEARAATVTRDACDRATVALAAETESEELPALVEHLRVTGQLTTALLLRSVCAGNVAFFEFALSVLARVPLARVVSLVRAGRLNALRAAYSRAGLPALAFDAFAAALDTWRQLGEEGETDRYRATLRMVDAVLTRYARITDNEAHELATMLRRFAADQARDAARDYARTARAA
ncbi:DUF2336 domain-containing protein [soil metagenome]